MNSLLKTLLTLAIVVFASTSYADRLMSIQDFLKLEEEQLALVVKICATDEIEKNSENCKNAYRAFQLIKRKPNAQRAIQKEQSFTK